MAKCFYDGGFNICTDAKEIGIDEDILINDNEFLKCNDSCLIPS